MADRGAAVVAAICFAYCPYVFAHTPHIQLLMTAGLPFSLLALHRLVDRPSARRGFALGITMVAQALFCGYYAIFVALMVGYGVLVLAVSVLVAFSQLLESSGPCGCSGSLSEVCCCSCPMRTSSSRQASAARSMQRGNIRPIGGAYLASSAYAHAWIAGASSATGRRSCSPDSSR